MSATRAPRPTGSTTQEGPQPGTGRAHWPEPEGHTSEAVTGPATWLTGRVTAPLVALLMLALAAAALVLLPGAGSANAPAALPEDAESAQVSRVLEGFPGGDTAPAVVVVTTEDGGRLDEATLGALGKTGPDLLEALPADARPDDARVTGPLPSEDGKAALLVVPVVSDALDADGPEVVQALRDATDDLAPDTTAEVTGAAGFAADVSNAFALFGMDNGGAFRTNELRRVGYPSHKRESRFRFFGEASSFEETVDVTYWHDKKTVLEVTDLISTGPHSVLKLRPADAPPDASAEEVERLIPFVDAYVDQVDLPARRITVDWGLDY